MKKAKKRVVGELRREPIRLGKNGWAYEESFGFSIYAKHPDNESGFCVGTLSRRTVLSYVKRTTISSKGSK